MRSIHQCHIIFT